jgi:hypothetical protein
MVKVGDRSSSAIRVGTHAFALVGTRRPSGRRSGPRRSPRGRATASGARPTRSRCSPRAGCGRAAARRTPRRIAPDGGDAAVRDRAVVGFDGPLTLALVQVQADDLHGGWPPGRAPRRRTVSA